MLNLVCDFAKIEKRAAKQYYQSFPRFLLVKSRGVIRAVVVFPLFNALYPQLKDSCTLTVICADGKMRDFDVDSDLFRSNQLVVQENAYSGIGMTIQYEAYKFGFGESLLRI